MNTEELLAKFKVESLSDMQRDVVDTLLTRTCNVIVLSPTGSGKTLAYLLPLVQRIDTSSDDLQAVVIVPGRELALQSHTVLKDARCGVRSAALYGGRPTMEEHRALRELKPHVVFVTPGRFNDHVDKGNLLTDKVKWAVIDEFDKCLSMGFEQEMTRALEALPHRVRRVLLSATATDAMPAFVNMDKARVVDYRKSEEKRTAVFRIDCPQTDKLPELLRFLDQAGQGSTVVFLNYRESVERVAAFLVNEGYVVSMYHGGLDQKQRERALYLFSNGSASVLVCTDLASRGLDIPDIENIVHYHLPETREAYTHRIGRTARWDKSGRAFFLLNSREQLPDYVEDEVEPFVLPEAPDIRRMPPRPRMVTLYIGKGKGDKVSKGDIVGFLCKKGGLDMKDIGRIDVMDRYAYAAVSSDKYQEVLKKIQGERLKGLKTLFELVKTTV